MDKYYKLAQLIKLAGKDISKPDEYAKEYRVHRLLGFVPSDDDPEILNVIDDSGFRAICLGDIRGNVSYDSEAINSMIFHKGYIYLYSEQCYYDANSHREWKEWRCFPTIKYLSMVLKAIAQGTYGKNDFSIYLNDDDDFEATKAYLSSVVEKYADKVWTDGRSAKEIFKKA